MTNSDVVIRVEGLGKKYSLNREQSEPYTALRDVFVRQAKAAGRLLNPFTLAAQFNRAKALALQERVKNDDEFWALKNVSFEICRGERVGIIGRNGAGKSTLLKILSRITEPTMGRVEILGRVASLLEVGTGFHPELTGRENIFLNGAILGMKRREINAKFDEIVDFAEVEQFLDLPVKRFSSGMYVRLAFAVAAHLEPEVLVVDEVLAVGDSNFQKKCLGKLDDIAERGGRTVLFVSHQMPLVASLCSRCLLIRDGTLAVDGNPSTVILNYQNAGYGGSAFVDYLHGGRMPGNDMARLLRGWIENHNHQPASEVAIQYPFSIHMVFEVLKQAAGEPSPNFHIYDCRGNCAFVSSAQVNPSKPIQPGIYEAVCYIPANLFNDGLYSVDLALTFTHSGIQGSFHDQHVLNFLVVDSMDNVPARLSGYRGSIPGILRPVLDWSVHTHP